MDRSEGNGCYDGTLELAARPAIQLTIDAASVDTDNARRDRHLRSPDVLTASEHPYVRGGPR
jgi:polyisoprenoid-binding protein YceI